MTLPSLRLSPCCPAAALLLVGLALAEPAAAETSPAASPEHWAEPGEPADEPSEARERLTPSVSLHAAYGTIPNDDATNRYGPGLGLRAGVQFSTPLYVGVSFEHFFGEPTRYGLDSFPGITVDHEARLTQALAWVGYALRLDEVTLRPMLGLGAGRTSLESRSRVNAPDGQTTRSGDARLDLAYAPALELESPVGPVSLLIQLRYNGLLGGDSSDNDGALVVSVGLSVPL